MVGGIRAGPGRRRRLFAAEHAAPVGGDRHGARRRRAAGAAGAVQLPVLRAPAPNGRRPGLADGGESTDRRPHRAPVFLLTAAACLAVGQVLEHVDGICRPSTVNGTLEWRQGDRRRAGAAGPSTPIVAAAHMALR